ncbi:hypothetical protein FHG87_011504 [Trinorchestia longiramus]|nr:hypothetical protein FHG87_011504 [Trinorchestia longiramus]
MKVDSRKKHPQKMAQVRSPSRHLKQNYPSTEQEPPFIIFTFGQLQSIKQFQMASKIKFFPNYLCHGPNILTFNRTVKKFNQTDLVQPQVSTSKFVALHNLETVKNLFEQNLKSHIRHAANMLGLSYATIWLILQKTSHTEGLQVAHDADSQSGKQGIQAGGLDFWVQFRGEMTPACNLTSVSQSGPYRPPGGGKEIQGGGRRVRLEWGAYITV